jgi:TPR repeat protein
MRAMRHTFTFLVLFSFTFSFAQNEVRYCAYDGKKHDPHNICATMGYRTTDEVEKIIDGLLEQVGLYRNFGVIECAGIENCMAFRQGNFEYIIYDSGFLDKIATLGFTETSMGTDWEALSILAHEVGHLLNHHLMVSIASTPKLELEADEFSGFVLAKLGATLPQAQKAMRSPYISDKGSYTHPPRSQRLAAIEKGWRRGGGNKINEVGENDKVAIQELKEAKRLYFAKKYTEAFRLHYKHRYHPDFDDSHMYNLGYMYRKGLGVSQNNHSAMEWYNKAAEKGNAPSMNNIGYMYRYGLGVSQNYHSAMEWYNKAAEKGNASAMNNIGYMYDEGLGVNQNYHSAMEWYRKAAEKGNATGMKNLGYMYKKGHGVSQNYNTAMEWYKKAAEKGNATAMNNIGYMYGKGLGVSQNYHSAMEWYKKAAEKGNASAMYNIGYMYRKGLGVALSKEKAIVWYQKAARKGDTDAQKILKDWGESW